MEQLDIDYYGKFECPCCMNFTLPRKAGNTFEICPVCFWEDDAIQLENIDYEGGANSVSLRQARLNFKLIGASEESFKDFVRKPNADELRNS